MPKLDSYFERIGWNQPINLDVVTLTGILRHHSCSIPFENIDVLERKGISLNEDDIFAKLVDAKRGGYCFEQNGLLIRILQTIGFDCTPFGARVRLQVPRSELPRRTHMFGVVSLEGKKWIVDAGFGGFSLTAPIVWDLNRVQSTPTEQRRLVQVEGRVYHQAQVGAEWRDLCEIESEMPFIDQELANWWTSTHTQSKFNNSLSIGLAQHDGTRFAVFNDRFTHRRGAEILDQFQIKDKNHLIQIASSKFGLELPTLTTFGDWPFSSKS